MATGIENRNVVSAIGASEAGRSRAYRPTSFAETMARASWRGVEVLVSLVALVLALPVILFLMLLIRLDSPGGALFRQTRIGKNFRPFTFVKLRTLYADARDRWPELYEYKYTPDEIRSLQFKREDDPRVTRLGRWLRKTTLDELPNFWNVLTGDMALVGPRPDIPEMVAYYTESQERKLSVKPGITGLAQTSGRGRLSFQETLGLDLEYVDNQSVWLDVKLIARTLQLLFSFDGAF